MDPSVASGHLVDASVAFAAVVLFQAVYCGLKFRGVLLVPDRSQLWTLIWLSCSLGLVGFFLSVQFFVMWRHDNGLTFVILTMWKTSSELSICCIEVALPALPITFGNKWLIYPAGFRGIVPHEGCLANTSQEAPQLLVMPEHRFQVLWALPVVMHIQFSAMAIYAAATNVDLHIVPSWVPWMEVTIGVCASTTAFAIIWTPHQTALQCLACILVVSSKGIRDWHKAHDDLNPPWYERSEGRSSGYGRELGYQAAESLKPSVSKSFGSNVELIAEPLTLSQSIPAPSDEEPSAISDVALDNGIFCVQTIEQTTEKIPDNLFETPSNNETWMRCLLTVSDFTTYQQTIEELRAAHVVGKIRNTHYEVAMTGACRQWFVDHDIPVLLTSESGLSYDLTEPTKVETDGFSVITARKAAYGFMTNALEAISSAKHGHGLERYYLYNTSDKSMLATLMWAFLLRDISVCNYSLVLKTEANSHQRFSAAGRRRFLQHCAFISLHTLEDAEISSVLEVLERCEQTWFKLFRDLCMDRQRWPLKNPKEEIHLVSLLRGLLESAEETDWPLPNEFDTCYSANDNFKKLGCLMDCDVDLHPVPFGYLNQDRVRWMRLRCKMFEGVEFDVTKMTEQIRKHVPVAFQDMERLPTSLIHTIQHNTVNIMRIEISQTYFLAPWLKEPENDMLIFLCCCLFLKTVDAAICEWTASLEGRHCYRQIIQGFWEQESMERTALRLLALFSFENLLPPRPDETLGPAHGCYLADFRRHLEGEMISNSRAMIYRMALSLRRVVYESCCPRICQFFDMMGTEPPLHVLDGVSDGYWRYKFSWKLDHIDAWTMAWDELDLLKGDTTSGVTSIADQEHSESR
ncbi:hypothetical protein S7711_11425 [Stachybotrys chartarum IBT 7711]|uniref:Uncharacterized protein n=1 Tax=Stachybotrys chartarum (strain CBS 109288 / IBT 7711) TaxID=1280523 RepID=A0A084B812_STACB|nr:hypothetical protein S7711_11425 [Stachybotrys chartarum IBT 7711]